MKWFKETEFACECFGELPDNGMNPILLTNLDKLREMYGYPIYVSCGYRCPEYNLEVGGVPNSQHVLGNAADIYVDGDYHKFYELVMRSRLFDAVGYCPVREFVHVDVRDNGNNPNYYLWEG